MTELQTPRHSVPRPDPDLNQWGPGQATGVDWWMLLLGIFLGVMATTWAYDYAEEKKTQQTTNQLIEEMTRGKK